MLTTIDAAAVHAAAAPDKPPLPAQPLPASPTSLFTRGISLETRSSLEAPLHGSLEGGRASPACEAAFSPCESPPGRGAACNVELPTLLDAAVWEGAARCSPFQSTVKLPPALQTLMQQPASAARAAPACLTAQPASEPTPLSGSSSCLLDGLATPCQSVREAAAPRSLPSSADSLHPAAAADLTAELHAALHACLSQHQAAVAAQADAGAAAAAAWLAQRGALGVAPCGEAGQGLDLANLAATAACSLPLSSLQLGPASGYAGLSHLQADPWLTAGGLHLPVGPSPAPPALHSALAAQLPLHLSALLVGGGPGLVSRTSWPALPPHRPGPDAQRHPGPGMRRQAPSPPPGPPEVLVGLYGRYQPYCQQVISPRMNEAATAALAAVRAAQAADPPLVAAAIGKRFFCSLKEVSKVVRNARCLVVAPDIQPSATAHINPVRALQRILFDAQVAGVPVVFALSRRGIGQVFGRDKSMSIVALMHLDGLEAEFGVMVEEAVQGRQLFAQYRGAAPQAATCAAPDLLSLGCAGYGSAATSLLHRLSL